MLFHVWSILAIAATYRPIEAVDSQFRFISKPTNVTSLLGSTVILPCKVSPHATKTIKWIFMKSVATDPVDYSSARRVSHNSPDDGHERKLLLGPIYEYNLQLRDLNDGDAGKYSCTALENHEAGISLTHYLKVIVPPSAPRISSDRLDVTEMIERKVKCTTVGAKPNPTIEWVVSRNPDGSNPIRKITHFGNTVDYNDIKGTAKSDLRFNPKREDHDQYLVCKVDWCSNGACGTMVPTNISLQSIAVKVKVQYKPRPSLVKVQPSNDSTLSLECRVDANPEVFKFEWLVAGVRQSVTSDRITINNLELDSHHKNLVICEATNTVGKGTANHTINMQYNPTLIESMQTMFELESTVKNFTVECPVGGNPPPDYEWRDESTKIVLVRAKTLVLSVDFRSKDLVCKGSSPIPGHSSAPVTVPISIFVKGAPMVSTLDTDPEEAMQGTSVQLFCKVEGIPLPGKVTWSRRECNHEDKAWKPLANILSQMEKKRFRGYEGETKQNLGKNVNRFVLNIVNVHGSDYSCYSCEAKNQYGSASGKIMLVEADPIPLFLMIPGVIGGAVAILLVAIALVCCNKKHLCNSKSSTSGDRDSDVDVKVEAMDHHHQSHRGMFPEMYASYSTKEYEPLPMSDRDGDIDNLPPPYNGNYPMLGQQHQRHSPSTFASNGSLPRVGNGYLNGHLSNGNGALVHMTYLDDSSPNQQHYNHGYNTNDSHSSGRSTQATLTNSPPLPPVTLLHQQQQQQPYTHNTFGRVPNGNGTYVGFQPLANNAMGSLPVVMADGPQGPAHSVSLTGAPVISHGINGNTNLSSFRGAQSADSLLPMPSGPFTPTSVYSPTFSMNNGPGFVPTSGYYETSPHLPTPLETLHEVGTPDTEAEIHQQAGRSSQQSTHV